MIPRLYPMSKITLHHRNELHFKIYYNTKQLSFILIIFHNITFYSISGQINAALVSIRDIFKKKLKKSYQAQTIDRYMIILLLKAIINYTHSLYILQTCLQSGRQYWADFFISISGTVSDTISGVILKLLFI